LSVQPNPFSDQIEITWNHDRFTETPQVALYDIQGRKMLLSQRTLVSSMYISKLDTLSSGVYFLKILNKGEVIKTFKMMKE